MLGSFVVLSETEGNHVFAPRVLAFLNDEDFFFTENKIIFQTIKEIMDSGAVVTDAALLASLPTKPGFGGADGMMMINDFLDSAKNISVLTIVKTAKTLRELSIRRRFADGINRVRHGLKTGIASVKAEVSRYILPVLNMPSEIDGDDTVRSADSVVSTIVATANTEEPLKTGIESLDRILKGGFKREWLAVIGARPSVGKTTLAINIISNVLTQKRGAVLFFTLEMSPEEIAEKIVSHRTQIAPGGTGHLPVSMEIDSAYDKLRKEPLLMCPAVKNIRDLVDKATRVHEHTPLSLIVVDYLQYIPQTDPKASRYAAVTEISFALKNLAKKTGVPVIALSQLSRPSTPGEESKPTLKDLRESGQIEQDANVVILLSKNTNQSDEEIALHGRKEVLVDIAKNRHGSIGAINTELVGATSTFIEI